MFTPTQDERRRSVRDGRLRIVDADTVSVILDLPAVEAWAYSLAIHPTDGSVVVGGCDGEICRVPGQGTKGSNAVVRPNGRSSR